jgi:hypothetical protein
MLRERTLTHPADFIEPCLPRPANSPPTGPKWIHEIKHDGYRIMAQRAEGRVRLLTRKAINFANRFPQIVAALTVLPVRSCLIDGEAVVCDHSGLAVFDLIRGYRHDGAAVLCAFDLLELDGRTCGACRSRSASGYWWSFWVTPTKVSRSTSTIPATARQSSSLGEPCGHAGGAQTSYSRGDNCFEPRWLIHPHRRGTGDPTSRG